MRHVAALLALATAPALAQPIAYTVSPQFADGALVSVAVDVALIADASGRTTIDLPDTWGGVAGHARYLSAISVEGGTIATVSPTGQVITSPPGAPLVLHYKVAGAYDHEPVATDSNLYAGIVVRPDWFEGLGQLFLVTPAGRDSAAASVAWQGWPDGWMKITSEDKRAATLDDVINSSFLAGKDVPLRQRPIPGGQLRFASHGAFDFSLDAYADQLAATISAQRRFWGDAQGDYTALLIKLQASPGHYSAGGTGRNHGFVQYASANVEQATLFGNIAHEHMHNWIPLQIGELPEDDAQGALYWLSEGFTDFYAARTLLGAGLMTPQQFVAGLNAVLLRLATSKASSYPNDRIAREFWTDHDVEQLPYDRGHLFAFLLGDALRRHHKPGLDQVLFAMRDAGRSTPIGSKPPLRANFLAQMDKIGFAVRPMLDRYIERGAPIVLPADLFGACATIRPLGIARFDLGYDREATSKAGGVLAGVAPDGPAYAAGLRNGMKRLAVSGGSAGDSRMKLTLTVQDGTVSREISYFPRGKTMVRTQEVVLNPALTPTQLAGCAASMAN